MSEPIAPVPVSYLRLAVWRPRPVSYLRLTLEAGELLIDVLSVRHERLVVGVETAVHILTACRDRAGVSAAAGGGRHARPGERRATRHTHQTDRQQAQTGAPPPPQTHRQPFRAPTQPQWPVGLVYRGGGGDRRTQRGVGQLDGEEWENRGLQHLG